MPGYGSHGNCKVCKARIHRSNRFGLCAEHTRERNAEIKAERLAMKARKAQGQDPITDAILDVEVERITEQWSTVGDAADWLTGRIMHSMSTAPEVIIRKVEPEPVLSAAERGRRGGLAKGSSYTEDQRLEAARLYEAGTRLEDIRTATGIKSNSSILRIAQQMGLELRGKGNWARPPHEEEVPAVAQVVEAPAAEPTVPEHADVPEPQRKALETMIAGRVPPVREPRARRSSVEEALAKRPGDKETWTVRVAGRLHIQAEDLEAVIAQVRRDYPGLSIQALSLDSVDMV